MVSQSPLVDEVMQDITNMIVFTFVNSKTVRNIKVNGKIITIARFTLYKKINSISYSYVHCHLFTGYLFNCAVQFDSQGKATASFATEDDNFSPHKISVVDPDPDPDPVDITLYFLIR